MTDLVLALNAGSSSIKFALFDKDMARRLHGAVTGMDSHPALRAFDREGRLVGTDDWAVQGYDAIYSTLIDWIEARCGSDRIVAVGHRIVHGGTEFIDPVRLDAAAMAALELLVPLAPLHQPHGLHAAREMARLRPDLPQVGCFDTAFHNTIPVLHRRYGLPREMEEEGMRKFGFHGLSFEYIAQQLTRVAPEQAGGRIIIAHLGSGASLCALQGGRSMDTSMGYSPLDGLVMSTRCGALDPGILLRLMRQGQSAEGLEDLLYRRAGLLGISGLSGDMQALLASPDARAAQAVDLFVFRLVQQIAIMAAALQGVDGIVFTAGIGENAPQIRRRAADRLAWLGLTLDDDANMRADLLISAPQSKVSCWVISTNEEWMIVRKTLDCLG